jgi:HK97 family phage portal protein
MGFWTDLWDSWQFQSPNETKPADWREEKASVAGPIISAGYVGNPVWTPRSYKALADEAFVRNAVGYRCVKLIAGAAAAAPWLLKSKGAVITEHPLLSLLKRPGPMVGGASLFEAFYAYLLIEGNGYLEGVGPSDRAPPRELWTHRPDRMKAIPGPYGLPQGFEYEANGLTKKWEVDPLTGQGPILHVKEFHPLNDWYGLGRMEPAAYGIDRHNAASAHNKALLDNGGRPSGALVFQPIKNSDGSMISAPAGVVKAAEKLLKQNHTGPKNAGKQFVFGGLVDWLEMGINPKDMDFAKGKDDAARDICLSVGVPHILVVPGSSTYNNVREAKLELYEDTVLPLHDKVMDALNAWLCPMFGDGLTLSADLDAIPALEPRRESKRKSTLELYDKGLIDDNEARESLGFGPRDPDAVGKIDATVLTALIKAASQDGGVVPLFRYLRSAGLLDQATTEEAFSADWASGLVSEADLLAATTPPDPNGDPANVQP